MSNHRQPFVRSYAVTHPPHLHMPARMFEDWDQLVFASVGVMHVDTAAGTWVVPPHRAVWIPAGTPHGVRMVGRVSLRTVFFERGFAARGTPRQTRAVNVAPLMRELVLQVCRVGVLYRHRPEHMRLGRVVLDQLETLPTIPLRLPLPADPRARRAAELLTHDPGRRDALDAAAKAARTSRRTLERLFVDETQLTLGRFHQRARLVEALSQLAQGRSVTEVALNVGYATPSGFVAAFKAALGTTPGRYFD